MSTYMNDYDVTFAVRRFTRSSTPNRLALALVVANLQDWTNEHSDGWAYWSKPSRAAARAIDLIKSTTNEANDAQEDVDITEDEMLAAVRPIKSFLTKMAKVDDYRGRPLVTEQDREIILRSTTC